MWNKVADIVQNKSTKRLALAILISAILHAYLVGGFDMQPRFKREMHIIEARLQMPKVVIKEDLSEQQPEIPATLPQVIQDEFKAPIDEPTIVDSLQDKKIVALKQNTIESIIPSEILAVAEKTDNMALEPQPIDAGLIINENAYQYVETLFALQTDIDGANKGIAKIVFDLKEDQHYQLTNLINYHHDALQNVMDSLQTSEGRLTKSGLQPLSYQYQFVDNALGDNNKRITFDWDNKKANLTSAKGAITTEISDDTQDLLSFMYQFMYVAPIDSMQINIATGEKLIRYDYRIEATESISIPMGEVKTIHIFHQGINEDEKIDLWLALDYQYVPVKIRQMQTNGKILELVATQINTARPIAPN